MVLSDRDMKKVIQEGRLSFEPALDPDQIGPASIDLRLSAKFKTFRTTKQSLLDPKKGLPEDFMDTHEIEDDEPFIVHPGTTILAGTVEYVKVPDDLVLRVEGKSTLARMGIMVHTAGYVDPGFEGVITLEVSNQSNIAVALYKDMHICQISVEMLSSPAEIPYNVRKKSLYTKDSGPGEAKTRNLFKQAEA